jgi:hypothetical protein
LCVSFVLYRPDLLVVLCWKCIWFVPTYATFAMNRVLSRIEWEMGLAPHPDLSVHSAVALSSDIANTPITGAPYYLTSATFGWLAALVLALRRRQ